MHGRIEAIWTAFLDGVAWRGVLLHRELHAFQFSFGLLVPFSRTWRFLIVSAVGSDPLE